MALTSLLWTNKETRRQRSTAAKPTITMPGNYAADPKPELAAKVGSLLRKQPIAGVAPVATAIPDAAPQVPAAVPTAAPAAGVMRRPAAEPVTTGVFLGGRNVAETAQYDKDMADRQAFVLDTRGMQKDGQIAEGQKRGLVDSAGNPIRAVAPAYQPNQNLEALRASGGRGILRENGEMMTDRIPDGERPPAAFDLSKVAGTLADAEQGLLRRNGQTAGGAVDPAAAPGTVPVGPAIMAAREKQKGTMADMAYGFASPMARQRIAGREGEVRQQGLMRTRQDNAVELANINADAAIETARAGVKPMAPVPPTVSVLRNKTYDANGKPVSEYETTQARDASGRVLDDLGNPIAPESVKQTTVDEAIAGVDQAMADTKGGFFNFGNFKGSDAAAKKKIDSAIMNAATVAFGRPPSDKEWTVFQKALASGMPLKDVMDQAMTSQAAAKP